MDKKIIDSLIALSVEMEGLLRVLSSRDSDEAMQLLAEKHSEYNILFNSFIANAYQPDSRSAADNASETEEKSDSAETHNIISDIAECTITTAVDDDVVVTSSESLTESAKEDETPAPTEVSQDNGDGEHKFEEKPSIQASTKTETAPNNDIRINDILTPKPNELRVDEMLSRREARNLRKAFTLNDKFRFRRELFANNDKLFARTLNDIQEMTSYDQALIYVAEQLGLDLENEDVADFMLIVQNHFNAI